MSIKRDEKRASSESIAAAKKSFKQNYLLYPKGLRSWALTQDHKRIALMYFVIILFFFFFGALFALGIQFELITPKVDLFAETSKDFFPYNKVFTLHGVIMIFLFVMPAIPAILGNFLLPLMLGLKNLAFPRLNLFSFYLYLLGAIFLFLSLCLGTFVAGWTFALPQTIVSRSPGLFMAMLGLQLLAISFFLTALNFIVTIHKWRPSAMEWLKMPIFVWTLYFSSIVQLLLTPLFSTIFLLMMLERLFSFGILSTQVMGSTFIYQHFFWFYAHPAIYTASLAAIGVMTELLLAHAKGGIFPYQSFISSLAAITILNFFSWGLHLQTSVISPNIAFILSGLAFLLYLPVLVIVFSWLAALYKAHFSLTTPMLYFLGFVVVFLIGGLASLFLVNLATIVYLQNTYFEVAHFHYLIGGGTLFALLGGLHHWWSKIFAKRYNIFWSKVAFYLIFVGFNLTFFIQFLLGMLGMPRHLLNYSKISSTPLSTWSFLYQISTFGAFILVLGMIVVLFLFVASIFMEPAESDPNPWKAHTLEWKTPTPLPTQNFYSKPTVDDPYPTSMAQPSPHLMKNSTAKKEV